MWDLPRSKDEVYMTTNKALEVARRPLLWSRINQKNAVKSLQREIEWLKIMEARQKGLDAHEQLRLDAAKSAKSALSKYIVKTGVTGRPK